MTSTSLPGATLKAHKNHTADVYVLLSAFVNIHYVNVCCHQILCNTLELYDGLKNHSNQVRLKNEKDCDLPAVQGLTPQPVPTGIHRATVAI